MITRAKPVAAAAAAVLLTLADGGPAPAAAQPSEKDAAKNAVLRAGGKLWPKGQAAYNVQFISAEQIVTITPGLSTHLETLNVTGVGLVVPDLTDGMVAELAKTRTLTELSLVTEGAILDRWVKEVSQMKGLTSLALRGSRLNDFSLDHLVPMADRLTGLAIDAPVGDPALKHVGSLTRLERLTLAGTRITDAGFELLGKLTRLKDFSVRSYLIASPSRVTGAGAKYLAAPDLTILTLQNGLTDNGLRAVIAACPKLTKLYAPGSSLTPDGAPALAGLKNLETLTAGTARSRTPGARPWAGWRT